MFSFSKVYKGRIDVSLCTYLISCHCDKLDVANSLSKVRRYFFASLAKSAFFLRTRVRVDAHSLQINAQTFCLGLPLLTEIITTTTRPLISLKEDSSSIHLGI